MESLLARVTVYPNMRNMVLSEDGLYVREFSSAQLGERVFGKEWVISFDRIRGFARMNRPSWWASVCAGQLTPELRKVYRDLHDLKLKIRYRPFEDLGCPVLGLRSLQGRYVKQSSLGHALRSLYLVAIAEGERGGCYRSGDELELPYMRVSFHRREPCVQRLSRSRL